MLLMCTYTYKLVSIATILAQAFWREGLPFFAVFLGATVSTQKFKHPMGYGPGHR